MKFAAKASTSFEIVPPGNHVAICNAIVDLGIQPGKGMYPDPKHEVYIRFELPTERIKYQRDGVEVEGPMSVSRTFTASMSEKANLRKFIESWFGKKFPNDEAASDFDLSLLLGRVCLVNITHTEKGQNTYANISNATPLPKGMKADYPQQNQLLNYSLETPDDDVFQKLPEWLRKKIDERIETKDSVEEPVGAEPFNDDIPW